MSGGQFIVNAVLGSPQDKHLFVLPRKTPVNVVTSAEDEFAQVTHQGSDCGGARHIAQPTSVGMLYAVLEERDKRNAILISFPLRPRQEQAVLEYLEAMADEIPTPLARPHIYLAVGALSPVSVLSAFAQTIEIPNRLIARNRQQRNPFVNRLSV